MTDISANTFVGPNQGNAEGYIPETTIESAKIDADLIQIQNDLDALLAYIQTAFVKLDQIDLAQLGAVTASDVVPVINASGLKIDADNLADIVVIDSELSAAISAHRSTTTAIEMHPETSIKHTELTYSSTPVTLITSCVNLLDELKNIRYQINRLNGKTNWSDTPATSLSALYSTVNNAISTVNSHLSNAVLHLTSDQHDALTLGTTANAINPYATVSDIDSLGSGDMIKAVYDTNNDGVVEKAYAIMSGTTQKTWSSILSQIASDIATHRSIASAHHTKYTNAEAIGAINGDVDHSSTATHYYSSLVGKPPADAFTSFETGNLKSSKLANGTTPWSGAVTLTSGHIPPAYLPIEQITSAWVDGNIAAQAWFGTSSGYVADGFNGSCMLLGGFGYVTDSYGYLQYSVNGGTTWNNCTVSPAMVRAPDNDGPNMYTWACPQAYIPPGSSFKIRAGSTFNGSSQLTFGAGYNIRYKYV